MTQCMSDRATWWGVEGAGGEWEWRWTRLFRVAVLCCSVVGWWVEKGAAGRGSREGQQRGEDVEGCKRALLPQAAAIRPPTRNGSRLAARREDGHQRRFS